MVDKPAPRRPGRPRGSALDRDIASISPELAAKFAANLWTNQDVLVSKVAAAKAQKKILGDVRKRRLLKPPESSRSKAYRVQAVKAAITDVPPTISASQTASILKKRGLFYEVRTDTLRKDIARIRKLARPS